MSVKIKKGSLKVNDNGEFKDIGVFVGDTRENIEAINEAGNAKLNEINEASAAATDIIATDRSQVTDSTKILINATTDNVVVLPTIEEHNKLADDISAINDDLNELKEQGIGGGSGIPQTQKTNFANAIRNEIAFVSTSHPFTDAFLAWLESGSDTPVNPPEDEPTAPTLTGITVTWSAESADVGTNPSSLITSVKANYSDGTSKNVTGYVVSPSVLAAGSQTVTVSYNGKTATSNIVGNPVVSNQAITTNANYPITLSWNPTENAYDLSEPLGELHSEYDVEIDVQSVSASTAYPVMAVVGSGAMAFCNWQTSAGQTGTLKATATIGFVQGVGATKCQLSCNKGSESSHQTCVVTGLRVYRK